jgi:hypothetical protein
MTELFGRSWELVVDKLDVSAFDFRVRVHKTLKPEPNKCLVEIYNLSPKHRAQLAELAPGKGTVKKPKKGAQQTSTPILGRVPCKISLGYGEDIDLIFLGDLRTVDNEGQEADQVTTIASRDGEKAFRTSRVNLSVGPKTPLKEAMKAVLKTFGLGTGNLDAITHQLQSGSATLPRWAVFSGSSARVLTDLCRSADIEWSIQDSVPVFLNLNKALDDKAVVISSKTGMVGSPSVDANGIMTCKTLIIPGLRCGRLAIIDSAEVKGNYRIEELVYDAQSAGQSWYTEVKGRRY